MKPFIKIIILGSIVSGCTKQVGKNPELAYSDLALLDTAQAAYHKYYQNDPNTVLNAQGGSPHGSFKLRFNSIAFNALIDNGKLPVNAKFPEGSFIVKNVLLNGETNLYAYMYKRNNGWIWGEAKTDGTFLYTKNNSAICVNCHSQPANRDLVLTFNFH